MRPEQHLSLRLKGLLVACLCMGFAVGYAQSPTQNAVLERGSLRCGISGLTEGDPLTFENSGLNGFYASLCQALAAAVIGNKDAVSYLPLSAETRWLALFGGDIDVLVGDVSLTQRRDTSYALHFGPVMFHQGANRFAPIVRHGDDAWLDIVSWVMYALIQAEEWEISAATADQATTGSGPLERFLGFESDLVTRLGLEPDALRRTIEQVGNYGEIYERHLGPGTGANLPRGPNALYLDGGLLYAPPFSLR